MDYRPTDYSRYHIEVVQYIPTLTLSEKCFSVEHEDAASLSVAAGRYPEVSSGSLNINDPAEPDG